MHFKRDRFIIELDLRRPLNDDPRRPRLYNDDFGSSRKQCGVYPVSGYQPPKRKTKMSCQSFPLSFVDVDLVAKISCTPDQQFRNGLLELQNCGILSLQFPFCRL